MGFSNIQQCGAPIQSKIAVPYNPRQQHRCDIRNSSHARPRALIKGLARCLHRLVHVFLVGLRHLHTVPLPWHNLMHHAFGMSWRRTTAPARWTLVYHSEYQTLLRSCSPYVVTLIMISCRTDGQVRVLCNAGVLVQRDNHDGMTISNSTYLLIEIYLTSASSVSSYGLIVRSVLLEAPAQVLGSEHHVAQRLQTPSCDI